MIKDLYSPTWCTMSAIGRQRPRQPGPEAAIPLPAANVRKPTASLRRLLAHHGRLAAVSGTSENGRLSPFNPNPKADMRPVSREAAVPNGRECADSGRSPTPKIAAPASSCTVPPSAPRKICDRYVACLRRERRARSRMPCDIMRHGAYASSRIMLRHEVPGRPSFSAR